MADKHKILMYPDYGDIIFWEDYTGIGDWNDLYIGEDETEVNINVEGLKEWFIDWYNESLWNTNKWTDDQWKEWWYKGLGLAKVVKTLLPADVELFYFTLKEPIWIVRPDAANDGGIFNEGEPIKID